MKTILALGLCGFLAGVFFWERTATSTLRQQNETLRTDKLEAEKLAAENRELPQWRSTPPVTDEQGSPTDLLRLRNEVRQLRSLRQEAEKLQAANERVATEIKSGQFTPRRLVDMEGAVPREKWIFAGFATPEAAVQSFIVALAAGDFEQIIRCLPPPEMESMRKAMIEQPEQFRKELGQDFMGGLNQFSKLSAFRITGVRVEEEGERAVVDVQFTAEGAPVPFQLSRYDHDGWKLRD
jgi:hypothetical protein